MHKILNWSTLTFLTFACSQPNKDNFKNLPTKEVVNHFNVDQTIKEEKNWQDSLVINYIKHTDNKLIQVIHKDSIEWLYDRTEKLGDTKYLVFQIGHLSEGHFTTAGWVYIDSLQRKIYEYDVARDSLILWAK